MKGEISKFFQVPEPIIYRGRVKNFFKSQFLYRVAEVGIGGRGRNREEKVSNDS